MVSPPGSTTIAARQPKAHTIHTMIRWRRHHHGPAATPFTRWAPSGSVVTTHLIGRSGPDLEVTGHQIAWETTGCNQSATTCHRPWMRRAPHRGVRGAMARLMAGRVWSTPQQAHPPATTRGRHRHAVSPPSTSAQTRRLPLRPAQPRPSNRRCDGAPSPITDREQSHRRHELEKCRYPVDRNLHTHACQGWDALIRPRDLIRPALNCAGMGAALSCGGAVVRSSGQAQSGVVRDLTTQFRQTLIRDRFWPIDTITAAQVKVTTV